MKPSDCTKFPFNSILKKSECEIVAQNIMVILVRTGDKFRRLSFEQYKAERLKDGNYSDVEEYYFKQVIDYCKSQASAKLFSKEWNN